MIANPSLVSELSHIPSIPLTGGAVVLGAKFNNLSKNTSTSCIGFGAKDLSFIPHIRTPPLELANPDIAFAKFSRSVSDNLPVLLSLFSL